MLSYAQIYQLARDAGLGKAAAITATAIAAAESGRNPNAVGDQSLTDAKWGPSIGLWQIRSLNADKGTGRTRDATKLRDPGFNARAMVAISGRGSNWGPWSVFNNGSHFAHLSAARAAAGNDAGPAAPAPPAQDADWWNPLPGDGNIPGYADDLLGWGAGAAGGAAGDAADAIGQRLMTVAANIVPWVGALALGVTLIGIGAWHTTKGGGS